MVIEISDLDLIRDSTLKKFDERLAAADYSNHQEIEREAARLESQLEQLYSFTALLARHESDVQKTAELWARLVRTCDVFASRISELSRQYSLEISAYDTILDIRSAAEELRALHCP